MSILDFKELSASRNSSPAGEDLEGLVRELGKRLGLNPEWSGRGTDQGRDLFFTEHQKGALGSRALRWLVSCKDFANSGRSVSEQDIGPVLDKVQQHKAGGFLLATTTTASTGLKSMLDGIQANGDTRTKVWDRHELENILLQETNTDLIKRYLPLSYSAYTRLSSLPQALDSLQTLVPGSVYKKIREVIRTYQAEDTWLTGDSIWPHDRASAGVIDLAINALLEKSDPAEAANELLDGEIEFDAFSATLTTLASFKPTQAKRLCHELIKAQDGTGPSLFAYRFYVEHYEPNNEEQITLAASLSNEDLSELYYDEVALFINEELIADPTKYRAWGDLDALSSHTRLEEAYVSDLGLAASEDRSRIQFRSSITISVELSYDREEAGSISFPGNAVGYIDANGIFIEDVSVDASSFYA